MADPVRLGKCQLEKQLNSGVCQVIGQLVRDAHHVLP